jgi:polyferredoxin
VFAVLACVLAHTFLAYFVGVDRLWVWMHRSPIEHPTSFLVMLGTTAAVFTDFTWFREQTCLVACPYGRLQSVLLDRRSLIVGYDVARGEPRMKGTTHAPSAGRGLRRLPHVRAVVPHRHRHPRWSADGVPALHAVHRCLRARSW